MPATALLVAAALAAAPASMARAEISVDHGVAAATSAPANSGDTAAEMSCQQAGEAAEQAWSLPPGLLAAIGRMESGRYDPASRRIIAWPWTINAAGAGAAFESRAAAIDAVRSAQMRGIASIDVGCFQVNLMYHPTAFSSLEQGFDARANADYAARFLTDLHDRGGSWERAVAWYHSATPGVGDHYRDRVLADWSGGGMRILPMPTEPQPGLRPLQARQSVAGDPFVVLATMHASGVRVWTPSWAMRTPYPATITPTTLAAASAPAAPRYAASIQPVSYRTAPASGARIVAATPVSGPSGRLPRIITPRG